MKSGFLLKFILRDSWGEGHSYERGLNENTNGLIRQYFPICLCVARRQEDRDFRTITDEELIMVMKKLNNRPRKTLGFLTPNEVFFKNYKIALTT